MRSDSRVYTWPASETVERSPLQRRVERYLRPGQRLRDRTRLLGLLGYLVELAPLDVGNLGVQRQVDARNLEPAAVGAVEVDVGLGVESLWLVALVFEEGRELHRETPRVGRADEFLGVRPGFVLEAGREPEGPLYLAALGSEVAASVLSALPRGLGLSRGHVVTNYDLHSYGATGGPLSAPAR